MFCGDHVDCLTVDLDYSGCRFCLSHSKQADLDLEKKRTRPLLAPSGHHGPQARQRGKSIPVEGSGGQLHFIAANEKEVAVCGY